MVTTQKHSGGPPAKLPHPRKAREDAGLSLRRMRALGGFGMGTICGCERTGRYPKSRATRALYLQVLGLPAEPLPVVPAPQPRKRA